MGGSFMQLTHAINRYFTSRDQLSLVLRLSLTLAFTLLTGFAAQIRIPLPFTPVPITGQVFAALLSGIVLGGCYGGLSQALYVLIGAMGAPWFSGWGSGMAIISGVTGGYIIGFIPAALMIGWLTDRHIFARKFHFQLLLMGAGVIIIYIFGAVQFAIVMNAGFLRVMKLAVLPFIPFDLMKAAVAAGISASIFSKSDSS